MTYQFDPKPEGLHYEPFTVPFAKKTMWWLRDGAPHTWIDLRSVFEAMGMSWCAKWGMYCLAKRQQWGLEACCDRQRRETLLAPGHKLPAILGEVRALLLGRHTSAARLVHMLHLQWREKYVEIQAGGGKATVKPDTPPVPTAKTRKRKVNAYVVRQVHVLLKKGHTKRSIAAALNISEAVPGLVASGTYPMDEEARAVWWDTFGSPDAVQANLKGLNKV